MSTKPYTAMTFTAAAGIYLLSPSVRELDIVDQIHARQTQLDAMLAMTFGEAGELFREMSDTRQDLYLGACASAADEIRQLTELLREAQRTKEVAA